MVIGYGRTSTIEQVAGLEAQIRDLKAAGAEKLFRENVSSVAPRKQLEAAIEFARELDILVVTKIDRLARSVRHLCEIVDRLQAKGVALRILNMNLDTNDATGKLMLQIIGSIAEFERNIMLSRQLEGIGRNSYMDIKSIKSKAAMCKGAWHETRCTTVSSHHFFVKGTPHFTAGSLKRNVYRLSLSPHQRGGL